MSKDSKIVAVVVGSVILFAILLFAGCSALANSINGGGDHTQKAAAMMKAADEAPEADWIPRGRDNPKVDPGCLSIDTPCLKLTASWHVDHPVDPYEVAERMGLNSMQSKASAKGGSCVAFTINDNGTAEICSPSTIDDSGEYQVNIFMSQR